MTSADIDIILKSGDFIDVQIYLEGAETWKKEYAKESKIEKMYEDYISEVRTEFPNEIKNILKAQRDKDVTIEEEPLLNYVNGYEEENSAFSKISNLEIPEIIGKPFSNPFNVFTYIKKEKALKLLKFGNNNILSELDDYNSSSSYCNGNNKLFISGGEKDKGEYAEKFWIIDLKTAEIESNDMIPKKNHSMIIVPGNYIFIVGGQTKQTFYFDIENSKFHGWKKLNKQRIEPALIVVDNFLYCFDNMNSNMGEKFTFEKTNLNSTEHTWELLEPNMPSMRMNQKYFGVVRNKNDIIFIGGNLDLEDENDNNNLSERKSFKYNIDNNSIEESETNYIDYNFKEKTFLKYNEKISYILPDFNRYHPEVMFYQKEKNAIKFLKCYSKKKLEEKEREKEEKNIRDFSPIKFSLKFNLNQPKETNFNDDNINTHLAKDFNKDEEIKLINENSENKNEYEENKNEYEENKNEYEENKNEYEENKNEYEENKNEYEEKKDEEQNNFEYDPNNIDNSNNYEHENNKVFNNEQNYGSNEFENPEKEKHSENYEQNNENEQNENGEQNVEQEAEQKEEQNIEQNLEQNQEQESNALNNDINTNNVELLEDMIKSSQHKPEENIEIKVEGNLMQNQDINLRGQINNINPEVKLQDTNNLGLTGNLGIETSVINNPKISMNLPQSNLDVNQGIDLKIPNLNLPQTNMLNTQLDVNPPQINGGLGLNMPENDDDYEFCYKGVMVGTNDDKAKYANINFGGNTNFNSKLNMPNMDANLNVPNMNMPNMDANLNVPNMNMPNIDTKLNVPNMNMPNIDTKLNVPNMNMPNMDANLNVPNVNMPNIDTKLNAPNIGLPQTNINLNSGNQNLEENEFGEFCISGIIIGKNETNPSILKANSHMGIGGNLGQLPNSSGLGIDTKLDNPLSNPINLNNSLKTGLNTNINGIGTGINIPEGGMKLDGNINLPSKSPEINLNTNVPNLNTSNQIGMNVPDIKLKSNLPEINVTNPTIGLPSANLDVKGAIPNLNTNVSNINTNLPGINTNINPINTNINTTGLGINMNNDNENGFFEMGGIIKGSNDVNFNTGNLNLPSGGINMNMNQNVSGINLNGPKLDINGNGLGANLNNPNMALGGNLNINNPSINLPSTNLNVKSPELSNNLNIGNNFKMSDTINVPKINITDSKVGGNFNGDIKANLPHDMNLNINPINILNQNNSIGLKGNIGTSNIGGFGISIGLK